MMYLYVVLASIFSFIVLFFLTKLMGNRELSQLSMFDYINGITIGSITADLATCSADNIIHPLISMIVYGLAVWGFAILSDRFIKVRRFIEGNSVILLENGKLFEKRMKKSKIDINELQMQCRNQGYFKFDDIETIILETNGKVSILPKSEKRPVNPEDLKLNVDKDGLVINVILDGEILYDNLKQTGNDETWLNRQLHSQNASLSQVMLGECDINNKLTVYKKKFDKTENTFDK